MTEDWRLRECINQVLLYLAFEARSVVLRRDERQAAVPIPLPPVKPSAEAMCQELARHPTQVELVFRQMDKLHRDVRDNAALIARSAPWRLGKLVEWWIKAGVAVADWQAAVGSPASASSADARLYAALVERLQLQDDEEWPPMWCATFAERWRLAGASGAGRPAWWDMGGRNDAAYRVRLLEWCGNPHREVAADAGDSAVDWAVDYRARYRDFARAALRILREGVEFESRSALETPSAWAACRGPGGRAGRLEVLRAPLQRRASAHDKPLVRGWLSVPPAARLIETFAHDAAALRSDNAALDRLIARARAAWDTGDTGFGGTPPAAPGAADAAKDTVRDAEHLMAVASLVAAVGCAARAVPTEDGTRPASAGGDDVAKPDAGESILVALALEGQSACWTPASGSDSARLLPLLGGVGATGRGALPRLELRRADAERPLEVGEIGPLARCSDDLLSGVEELDWRLWALDAIGALAAVEPCIAVIEEVGWEPIKRRLLAGDEGDDAAQATLVTAFELLHRARLLLPRHPAATDSAAVAAWLGTSLGDVERVICRRLVSLETGATVGLHPPRKSDGSIALDAWLDAACGSNSSTSSWEIDWQRSPEPFGTMLAETPRGAGGGDATFSAGEAVTDADLRLLRAPGVTCPVDASWQELIVPHRERLRSAVAAAAAPDFSTLIGEVRAGAAGSAADAFDAAVNRAADGDATAVAWVRIMHDDARFELVCHPAIAVSDTRVSIKPPESDAALEWRDDATVPVDQDIGVHFATDAARARRVVSRGLPAPSSAEACAARLVAALKGRSAGVVAAAAALQMATDRRRMFKAAAPDPLVAAVAVADALAAAGEALGSELGAFEELAKWFRATGSRLEPAEWHPTQGVSPGSFATDEVGFHPVVPAERLVVNRFGAVAADGTVVGKASGFLSVGPPPPGFVDIARMAESLVDEGDEIDRFRRYVAELPRRWRSGPPARVAAGLFEVLWKAIMATPGRNDLLAAADAVHQFLDRGHEMLVFVPKTLEEYQQSWLREVDGQPPKGRRVNAVLRPGLRTLDNSLVFPAIVKTE